MGYAVEYEFPGVCGKYPDISELLCLYKKLTGEYSELLKEINDTKTALENYQNQIQTLIPGWISAEVQKYVDQLNQFEQEFNDKIVQQNTHVTNLLAEYTQKLDTQFANQDAKVAAQLSQMMDAVQNQILANENWVKSKLNEFEVNWKWEVAQQQKQFQQMINQQNDKVDKQLTYVAQQQRLLFDTLNAQQSQIDTISDEMNNINQQFIDSLNNYNTLMRLWYWENRYKDKKWLEEEIAKMKEFVENIPQSSLPVNNPIQCDRLTTINQWVQDAYNYVFPQFGYSAWEWNQDSAVSCEVWNLSNMKALDWYIRGKELLDHDRNKWMTFSPITGEYVWLGTAIQQVADALNGKAISAGEYDALNRTAQEYDEKNITAKQYYEGGIENV